MMGMDRRARYRELADIIVGCGEQWFDECRLIDEVSRTRTCLSRANATNYQDWRRLQYRCDYGKTVPY